MPCLLDPRPRPRALQRRPQHAAEAVSRLPGRAAPGLTVLLPPVTGEWGARCRMALSWHVSKPTRTSNGRSQQGAGMAPFPAKHSVAGHVVLCMKL
eukprot:361935-Chlamydomonas_euryale.AAC.15